jgi:hypothetical protein
MVHTTAALSRSLSRYRHKQSSEPPLINHDHQHLREGDTMVGKPRFGSPELGSAILLPSTPAVQVRGPEKTPKLLH